MEFVRTPVLVCAGMLGTMVLTGAAPGAAGTDRPSLLRIATLNRPLISSRPAR